MRRSFVYFLIVFYCYFKETIVVRDRGPVPQYLSSIPCARDTGEYEILRITRYIGREGQLGNTVPRGMVTGADMGCRSYGAWIVWRKGNKADTSPLVSHGWGIKETPIACPPYPQTSAHEMATRGILYNGIRLV